MPRPRRNQYKIRTFWQNLAKNLNFSSISHLAFLDHGRNPKDPSAAAAAAAAEDGDEEEDRRTMMAPSPHLRGTGTPLIND